MKALRSFLVTFLIALLIYTVVTVMNHGWNLFPYFFGDMISMTWAGQFNFDFMGFLILSAIWTIWRNRFSAQGFFLGILAFFGGMLFLSIYILYLSFRCNGDMQQILIGEAGGNEDSL